MSRTADVIVIGGGIHGCSTALHLALRGLKPILVEKDYAGRHASGVNAGGVRQLARHLAEIPLSVASMALWERIERAGRRRLRLREPRHGAGGRERGRSSTSFRARVDDLRLQRLHARGADRSRRAEAPGAGGRPITVPAASSRAATARPIRSAPRRPSRKRAIETGAEVIEGVTVTGLARAGGVWRVETSDGPIEAPKVVNAAGAWADRIAAAAGRAGAARGRSRRC